MKNSIALLQGRYVLLFLALFCNSAFTQIKKVPCWFNQHNAQLSCYYETHLNQQFPVVTLHHDKTKKLDSPILFIDGGPGQKTLSYPNSSQAMQTLLEHTLTWRQHRDVIFFTTRGVGLAKPNLQCLEWDELAKREKGQALTTLEVNQLKVNALLACHQRLSKKGIQFNHYNTQAIVGDIHALLADLHIHRVNLYAISYGGRVALNLMREYPRLVRSTILDSPDLPNSHHLTDMPELANHSFQLLFKTFQKAHPDLSLTFQQTFDSLQTQPVLLKTHNNQGEKINVLLNGVVFANAIFNAMHDEELIPTLPDIIEQTRAHHFEAIAGILAPPINPENNISLGMAVSVECHDDFPFEDKGLIQKELKTLTPASSLLLTNIDRLVCDNWQAGKANEATRQFTSIKIPTLILSGKFDPITPPFKVQQLIDYIAPSYFFVFNHASHDVLDNNTCARKIVKRFIENINQSPMLPCFQQQDNIE